MYTQEELGRYGYAREKLSAAVIKLAIGEGGIKSRLRWVHDSELCGLTRENFPDELIDDWQNIIKELTKLGPSSINGTSITIRSISNTLHGIRNVTGVKIAQKICDLKYKIDTFFELPHQD